MIVSPMWTRLTNVVTYTLPKYRYPRAADRPEVLIANHTIHPDLRDAPPRGVAGPLRIVLAHSPDQFGWARRNDGDLVLAGHTHGGQVHLPVVGACASASRYGSRYAAGAFFQRPTVLHVSRGLSQAMPPFRVLCPPELAVLELQPR